MTATIIDGKAVSQEIKEEVKVLTEKLNREHGITPGLAFILVGDNPASQVYVKNKAKACESLGFYSLTEKMPEDTSEEKVLAKIDEFNQDDRIHGILVQMPLPKQISEYRIIEAIHPSKDVDGLHPFNIGLFSAAKAWDEIMEKRLLLPCTPYGMMVLLEKYGIEVTGKRAVVVGRSNLGGKPTAMLLLSKNATVTIAHSRTANLAAVCREADILVAVIGKPLFIKKEFIKPGAAVLDVGINRTDGGLVGDVDFEAAKEVAGWITPVPGGVGAMTISMLMRNTLMAAEKKAGEINSKYETLNSKQTPKPEIQNAKKYDLEERTESFSKRVIDFVNGVPKDIVDNEIIKQLVRSSGSVGANYIEANESLSRKDYFMRAKISRKEAKETRYWLRLIKCNPAQEEERSALIQEATELMKILGAIITKSGGK